MMKDLNWTQAQLISQLTQDEPVEAWEWATGRVALSNKGTEQNHKRRKN